MKSLKIATILLVFLLAAMVMVPMASAAPDKIKTDANFVSVEKATSVANLYVQQISGSIQDYSNWKGATVQKATTYYDLNGKESAYSFEVLVNGQYAGYLMVSATRDNYPVLEFSKGKTPDREISTQTEARELAATVAKSQQASLGSGRPLYLGATFFYMEYPVEQTGTLKSATQTSQDKILVDLYEKKIVDPKKVTGSGNTVASAELTAAQSEARAVLDQKAIQKFQQQKTQEAQAEWDAIDRLDFESISIRSDLSYSIATSQNLEKILSPEPPYYQWQYGCSPTSGAMILGYWRNQGLTRIPSDTDSYHGDPLNHELADRMHTCYNPQYCIGPLYGLTLPFMIASGINTELDNYQYGIADSQYGWYAGNVWFPSWNDFQGEIDNERPSVLSMWHGGGSEESLTSPYGDHSVAVVGYIVSDMGQYLKIHDTWEPPQLHHIRYNNWWAAMNTWVRSRSYTITSSTGSNGKVDPIGVNSVPAGTQQQYMITPDSGFIIDDVLVDGSSVGSVSSYLFSDVTADHTISATFKENLPAIVPLCPAGTPFDATQYPQNWPESDPMTFQCNWDGNGRVYISGEPSVLNGVWADDGFTITIQPSGATFDAVPHYGCQHNILELTGGMTPGLNSFTLIVKNWMGLSMSYGSSTGIGTDQTPYIIEVNSPALVSQATETSTSKMPPFVTGNETGLLVNGTLSL